MRKLLTTILIASSLLLPNVTPVTVSAQYGAYGSDVSRSDFVESVVNTAGLELQTGLAFKDTNKLDINQYIYPALCRKLLLSKEYNGYFYPDRSITQIESLKLAVRTLATKYDLSKVIDAFNPQESSEKFIFFGKRVGLISLNALSPFAPESDITKEQADTMIQKLQKLMNYKSKDFIEPEIVISSSDKGSNFYVSIGNDILFTDEYEYYIECSIYPPYLSSIEYCKGRNGELNKPIRITDTGYQAYEFTSIQDWGKINNTGLYWEGNNPVFRVEILDSELQQDSSITFSVYVKKGGRIEEFTKNINILDYRR